MEQEFEEIDMAEGDHVAWVKSQSDPSLWHLAAMAALAYRGDRFGFLPWLVKQADMDRSTGGWIFLWAEGSRYLRGQSNFYLNHISNELMLSLFRLICDRSENLGFARDECGLDPDFEHERNACLEVVAKGEVAPGIVVPKSIISRKLVLPKSDRRFALDDGFILRC